MIERMSYVHIRSCLTAGVQARTRDTSRTPRQGKHLMARKIRSYALENRTQRLKLPVAKKPVFVRIGSGISLGYRRNQTTGSWVLRVADGRGGARTSAIGSAD